MFFQRGRQGSKTRKARQTLTSTPWILALVLIYPAIGRAQAINLAPRFSLYECAGINDYSGLQQAINNVGTGGLAGILMIASGTCDLGSNTLSIPPFVTVRGMSEGLNVGGVYSGTVLKYSGSGAALRGARSGYVNRNIIISDLTILCRYAAVGIDATGWQFGSVRDVAIVFDPATAGVGVRFASANNQSHNSNAYYNTIENAYIYDLRGIAVAFLGSGRTDAAFPSGQNQNRIVGGVITALTGIVMNDDGVVGDYHDGNFIAGVDFENDGCANCVGVEIDQGIQNTLDGNRYEFAASATAVKFGAHSKGNLVLGGYTYSHYVDASGVWSAQNPNAYHGPFGLQNQQVVSGWRASSTCAGTVNLAAGAATVTNSCLQAGRSVTCTEQTTGVPNAIGCVAANGSLSIRSSSASDSSAVSWVENN